MLLSIVPMRRIRHRIMGSMQLPTLQPRSVKLRSQGVSVLGVFAGEEKDLATEKKIFGKDFAYIRNITGFSKIVGRYLTKQLEDDE
ncbi:MAG: hypothetical protein ACLRW4_10730 [Ruminococcus sp.]